MEVDRRGMGFRPESDYERVLATSVVLQLDLIS